MKRPSAHHGRARGPRPEGRGRKRHGRRGAGSGEEGRRQDGAGDCKQRRRHGRSGRSDPPALLRRGAAERAGAAESAIRRRQPGTRAAAFLLRAEGL